MMDNIFSHWERILRWIYPGGLFFVLLLFSPPDLHIRRLLLDADLDIALKLLAFFSIGVLIYLMQNFFIRLLSDIFIWAIRKLFSVRWLSKLFAWAIRKILSTWGIRKLFSKRDFSLRDWYLGYVKEKIENTMETFTPETSPTYDYDLWARYHAVNISAWLLLLFVIFHHGINNFTLSLPILIWLLNLHYYYFADEYVDALIKKKAVRVIPTSC